MRTVEYPMIRRMLAFTLLGAALASIPARADQDAVQFFSNIDVGPDATVHDAVCFFCNVNLEGKATGDVVVLFGNVHIAANAEHDVVNIFGRVTVDDNATIDHDLVNIFGGIRTGDNVHIGQDIVAIFGALETRGNVTVDGSRVVEPAVLFYGPLIFLVVVLVLIVREFRAYRRRAFLRAYGFPPQP